MTHFEKYAHVNETVCRLTANRSLQTFFTLYLMAETTEERQRLDRQFDAAWQTLSGDELARFKTDFTASFKSILPILKDANRQAKDYLATNLSAQQMV